MKIVSPSFELLPPHGITQQEILQRIERCGRICYKSEDKITEDSCTRFVSGIISRGHEAVLEHASLIFLLDYHTWFLMQEQIMEMEHHLFHSFLRFTYDEGRPIVSGNVRAWRDYLKAYRIMFGHISAFMAYPISDYPVLFPEFQDVKHYEKPVLHRFIKLTPDKLVTVNEKLTHYDRTVIFTCDRGVSHEIVRHRSASYCQESTRYCNYSKEKFNGEIAVIEPSGIAPHSGAYARWEHSCEEAENAYFSLLDWGLTPQDARAVLPTCLKTEVCMTATLREWRHFLSLRGSVAAHPQIRELALPLCGSLNTAHGDVFGDVAAELGL